MSHLTSLQFLEVAQTVAFQRLHQPALTRLCN
jgi:hypothetical protein